MTEGWREGGGEGERGERGESVHVHACCVADFLSSQKLKLQMWEYVRLSHTNQTTKHTLHTYVHVHHTCTSLVISG